MSFDAEFSEKIEIPAIKRVCDVVLGFCMLVVLSPVAILIFIAFCFEGVISPKSRGRIIYSETRISQGMPFQFYKFRIFKESALRKAMGQAGVIQTKTLEGDPANLTLVGKVLKQVYLDELPQLFNVLKGEMSLVGPRPTNPEKYERGLAMGKRAKKLLKAGITGYFQSHKGRKLELNQEEMDMAYADYCRNNPGWKIVLRDLKILAITVYTVFRAEGI